MEACTVHAVVWEWRYQRRLSLPYDEANFSILPLPLPFASEPFHEVWLPARNTRFQAAPCDAGHRMGEGLGKALVTWMC